MWIGPIGRRYADQNPWRGRAAVLIRVRPVLVLMTLHAVDVMVGAGSDILLLPAGELASFGQAVYFSIVTFTTLGYGDITLSEGWRMLSGIEALNGILLIGWTTAMLFAVVQHMWRGLASNNNN